jgi:NitT/TauT family transport system substrate-binding protein
MRIVLATAVLLAAMTGVSFGQTKTKLTIAYTAGDSIDAFAAKDEGFFEKQGLDVDLVRIPINSNIVPALVSGSAQVGTPTAPVFLHAADGGLDLVALTSASVITKDVANIFGIVARNGTAIKTAKDFVGKKIGNPGIGGVLDILFRKWLVQNGVDPASVQFVEVSFSAVTDVLKSGNIDAAISTEPFLSRLLASGAGYLVTSFANELPGRVVVVLFASTREWADKNRDVAERVRTALAEGAKFVNGNRDKAVDLIVKYTKVPREIVAKGTMVLADTDIEPTQLKWWIDVMAHEKMLHAQIDPAKLIFK